MKSNNLVLYKLNINSRLIRSYYIIFCIRTKCSDVIKLLGGLLAIITNKASLIYEYDNSAISYYNLCHIKKSAIALPIFAYSFIQL